MEEKIDTELEKILKSIEFPDEDSKIIKQYLDNRDFSANVMRAIEERNNRVKRIIFWIVFTLLNIIILSLLGTNQFMKNDYFALHNALATLFYLFLGVSIFCGITGLIIYIDKSWFEDINHLPGDIVDGINKVRKRFLGR